MQVFNKKEIILMVVRILAGVVIILELGFIAFFAITALVVGYWIDN